MKRVVVSGLLFMMVTLIQPLPVSAGETDIRKVSELDGDQSVDPEKKGSLEALSEDDASKEGSVTDTNTIDNDTVDNNTANNGQGTSGTDPDQNPDQTQNPPQEGSKPDSDQTQEPSDPSAGEPDDSTDETDETDETDPPAEGVRTLSGTWVLNGAGWWFACEDGSWPAGEIAEIGGARYAFNEAGYMITGWYQNENGWFYFDGSGAMHTDWLLLGNTWYYLDAGDQEHPGRMVADCEKVIRGSRYFFTSNGDMQTDWVLRPEGWYYVDKGGGIRKGWLLLGNVWYYLDGENAEYPGLMCEDEWKKVNGAWYYLMDGGAMAQNWLRQPEGWYYLGGDGARKAGWQLIGGAWYYLDAQNAEYPNRMCEEEWKKINGVWYYLTGSGAMATGWVHLPEGWYYTDASGARKTGWQAIGGAWYYLDGENTEHPGLMVEENWKEIGGKWYYLTGSGAMAVNWLSRPEGKYYVGSDGARRTGWQKISGNWYYFYTEDDPDGNKCGVMAANTVIDGWNISASGIGTNGTPGATPGDVPGGESGDIQSKIEYIKQFKGVPYVLGGNTTSGWDCSGFTWWALKYLGVSNPPRTALQQSSGGINVNKNNMSEWKPGDILVYTAGGVVNHVALYLGNGQLMHALNPTTGTTIQGVEYYEQWDSRNQLALVRRYL